MTIDSMNDLFVHTLRDTYHAEKQILRALPQMEKKTTHGELKEAFAHHRGETETHVERLEKVFDTLGTAARGVRCEAIEGTIEEAREMMQEVKQPDVLDAGLIGGAQKVEHYEIASYGTLVALARALGHDEAARLLDETLAEEKAADEKLNRIALTRVNKDALRQAAQ